MNKYLSASLNNVSMDLNNSWAAQTFKEALGVGKYARFQQKQMQEKEEKLLKLYENQQQRAFDKVGRGSAGSTTSLNSTGGGKVRQMFDERRQKAGIDKSYPLEPLKSKNNSRGISLERKNGVTTKSTIKSTSQSSINVVKNGKPIIKKKEIVERLYDNDNGKEFYEENRYDSDSNDVYHSKSHREILEMTNNHNFHDDLDNEVMPQIGFDEYDNTFRAGKLYTPTDRNSNGNNYSPADNNVKKNETKNNVVKTKAPTLSNGVSSINKNENPTKRNSLPNTKKNPTQQVRNNVTSPKSNTPTSPSKTPTGVMGERKPQATNFRVPSNNRPTQKQTSPRAVVVRDDLNECNYCGRRFAQDRIQKHEEICSKTGKKKRKPYDATKHRVIGTELESYVITKGPNKGRNSSITNRTSKQSVGNKKDWRRKHEEFISAIRAAKEAQAHIAKGGKLSDLPPPPPSTNPDYVQCPHCNRRFNESAAQRHIPKCADYQFNKPKPTSKQKIVPQRK